MFKRSMAIAALSVFALTAAPIAAASMNIPGWSAEAAKKKMNPHTRVKSKSGLRSKASSVNYNSYQITPSGYKYR